MSRYRQITDSMVAPYWPINNQLIRRYRDNAQHVRHEVWNGGLSSAALNVAEGSPNDNTWVSVTKLQVLINEIQESPVDGSTAVLSLDVQVENDASVISSITTVRLVAFGTTGSQSLDILNPSSSNTVNEVRAVGVSGTTVTTGALNDVTVEVNCDVSGPGGTSTVTVGMSVSRYGWFTASIG